MLCDGYVREGVFLFLKQVCFRVSQGLVATVKQT